MQRTKSKRADWISIIEAGYSLEGSERQWFDNLYDHAEGLLDSRGVRFGATVHYTPTSCELGLTRFPKIMATLGPLFHASLDEQTIDLLYRQGNIVDTASNLVLPKYPRAVKLLENLTTAALGGAPDMFAVNCQTGTGDCVIFSALLRERRKPTALERKRWPQVAAHERWLGLYEQFFRFDKWNPCRGDENDGPAERDRLNWFSR